MSHLNRVGTGLLLCSLLSCCGRIAGFQDYEAAGASNGARGGTAGAESAMSGGRAQGGALSSRGGVSSGQGGLGAGGLGPGGAPDSAGMGGEAGSPTGLGGATGSGGSPARGGTAGASAGGAAHAGAAGATNGGAETGGANSGGGAPSGGAPSGGAPSGGSAGTTSSTLLDQCVLLMHFEESGWSGTTAEVQDSSGLGNHGTASNTATTTSANGKFGRAASFDGTGWVIVPDSPSLRATTALTYSAWIYPTGLDGSRSPGIITKRRGFGDSSAYTMFLWSNDNLYVDLDGEDNRFASNTVFQSANWYHVAVVYDATLQSGMRAQIYVNGVLDIASEETSTSISPYDSDLLIGDLPGGGDTFMGRIDEVAIWTRALSATEIAQVYARTAPL